MSVPHCTDAEQITVEQALANPSVLHEQHQSPPPTSSPSVLLEHDALPGPLRRFFLRRMSLHAALVSANLAYLHNCFTSEPPNSASPPFSLVTMSPRELEELLERGTTHDCNKYVAEERLPYAHLSWPHPTYRRDRYRRTPCSAPSKCTTAGIPKQLERASAHHREKHRHHIEYHAPEEYASMSTVDLLELCADWHAIAQETGSSSLVFFASHVATLPSVSSPTLSDTSTHCALIHAAIELLNAPANCNWQSTGLLPVPYLRSFALQSRTLPPFCSTNLFWYHRPDAVSARHLLVDPGAALDTIGESTLKEVLEEVVLLTVAATPKLVVFLTHHHRDHVEALDLVIRYMQGEQRSGSDLAYTVPPPEAQFQGTTLPSPTSSSGSRNLETTAPTLPALTPTPLTPGSARTTTQRWTISVVAHSRTFSHLRSGLGPNIEFPSLLDHRTVECCAFDEHPDRARELLSFSWPTKGDALARRDDTVGHREDSGVRGDDHSASLCFEPIHAPGHTDGHAVLYERQSGTLLAGDHVMGHGSAALDEHCGNMRQYLTSTDLLKALRPLRVVLPAHGEPSFQPVALLQQYIDHRMRREASIRQAIADLGAADLDQIVASVYAAVPKEMWPFAKRNVRLHVDKLVEDGQVEQEKDGTRYHCTTTGAL